MLTIDKIIASPVAPESKNVLWLDTADPDNLHIKANINGQWIASDDESKYLPEISDKITKFGEYAFIEGNSTTDAKDRGITEESTDSEIVDEWKNSDPESDKFALARGEASHIEGNNCLALGKNSHAEGNGTIASNNSSHSEGTGTKAIGKYAHAEGLETQAIGERSHAEGQETVAEGKQSHAEGKHTIALANGSHVEGLLEPRTDRQSFDDRIKAASTESKMYQTLEYEAAEDVYAIGQILWKISSDGETWTDVRSQNIKVTAVYGNGSTWFSLSKKLGIGNKAIRYVKVITEETEVYLPQTEGEYSHAEGVSTQTKNEGEHAEGTYNKSNTNTISSIGIGTSHEDRKNAFEVMKNGDAYLLGVGGYDGTSVSGSIQSLQSVLNLLVGDFSASSAVLDDSGVNVSADDARSLLNKWILRVDRGNGIELMHRVETSYSISSAYSVIESRGYSAFYVVGVWGYDVYYSESVIDGIDGVVLIGKIDAGGETVYTMFSYAV